MPTLIQILGFEHGVVSANGGGLGRTVTGTAPRIEIIADAARTGGYGLKIAPTASAAGRLEGPKHAEVAVWAASVYVKFAALPTADSVVIQGEATAGTANPSIVFNNSTGKLCLAVANSDNTSIADKADFGAVVTTDTWYLVDLRFNVSANPWALIARMDGANEGSTTSAQGADTIDAIRFGHTGAAGPAHTTYFDDVVISGTSGDYPIGAHAVAGLLPAGDGTHNAGTNIMENQAGTDIGTVTAYDLVDDVPMSTATTYIQQLANGTGNYAEVQFANLTASLSAVWGAMGILAYTSATTSANNGACIMSKDDFSTSSPIHGTAASPLDMSDGSTSNLFYKSAMIAGVTDNTTANALEARVGFSGDANPDPYWVNLLVEVAYVPDTGLSATANQASETDTAQSFGKLKNKAIAQTDETDLAQALVALKLLALGQVNETDLAQVLSPAKTLAIGQAEETDTAQAITRPGQTVTVEQASETDTAQALTAVKSFAAGQAAETDTAQSLTAAKSQAVGLGQETDAAQSLTSLKTAVLEQATESDLSQAITSLKTLLLGLASETDAAQPVTSTGQQVVMVNQAEETDTAQSVGRLKTAVLGQSAEADLAQALTSLKALLLGQATESDLAQAFFGRKAREIGQATESDLAQGVTLFVLGVYIAAVVYGVSTAATVEGPATAATVEGSVTTATVEGSIATATVRGPVTAVTVEN